MVSIRMLAGLLPAVALLLFVSFGRAGEPIQFSNDKAKPAPAQNRPVDADIFKSWSKSRTPAGSPLNSLTPFITPGRSIDPREERRLKVERDERKNWMLLEPGELQKREEEEENRFGGRSVTIDNADSTEDGNYLFYNVTSQKSDRQVRQQNPTASDDEPTKDTRQTFSILPRDGEKHGAHTASELNLKGLIDPAQVSAPRFNNNEASLFQFFKDNAPPPVDRDQQARRDSFRDFINGPQPNAAPSGISDPINFRTDLTQERMNPIAPVRPTFDMSGPAKGADNFSIKPPPMASGFTPGRAVGLPDMVNNGPRQPMTGNSFPSPLAIQNETPRTPRASVMGSGSMFNRDAPRRGGL